MTHAELEIAVQAACKQAAALLENRMQGMSCYLKNWRSPAQQAEIKKAA